MRFSVLVPTIALGLSFLTPSSALADGAARPPNGTYVYTYSQQGGKIGTMTLTIAGDATTTTATENTTIVGYSALTTLVFDAQTLRSRSYTSDVNAGGATAQHIHLAATVTATGAHLQVNAKSIDIPAKDDAPTQLFDDNVLSGEPFLPAIVHANSLTAATLYFVPASQAASLTVVNTSAANRPADIPANDTNLTVSLQGAQMTIWYDPATYIVGGLEFPSAALSVRLTQHTDAVAPVADATAKPLPTPLPLPPAHFTSSDVRFHSFDGIVLDGTLTVPERPRAAMPAVVLVHGSGPVDRDERIGPNRDFAEVATALSNAGYVVLRYDKRGVGKSGGSFAATSREMLLRDAHAAIAFVRRQARVDRTHVYVLGHSEGGELVPSVAIADPTVRGIILMAPPAISLADILTQQLSRGRTPQAAAASRARWKREAEQLRKNQVHGVLEGGYALWLRTSIDVDLAKNIALVPCPILILQGEHDIQVLPTDLPRLVAAAKAAHRDLTVRRFANVGHLFLPVPADTTLAPGSEEFLPEHIDPAALQATIAWLRAH